MKRCAVGTDGDEILLTNPVAQAVPHMQDLTEYKLLEDDEARKVAFAKFVKRQKAC